MTISVSDQVLVERRLEDWRRRLIDLSHRNRLIAYRPTLSTTLTIVEPTLSELLAQPLGKRPWEFFFPPEPREQVDEQASEAAEVLDSLVVEAQGSAPRRRSREIEVTEKQPKRIARILDNLAKRSNAELQDKALRILYVAAGFLDWRDGDRDVTSPLVLVPVELRRESPRDPYRLFFVEDEDVVINPSLTEKLRRDAGLEVPADWAWEDKPIAQELDEIRAAIKGTEWSIREAAVIGLFSFQKYVMYRDLLDNSARLVSHPIVQSLAQGALTPELRASDPDVPLPKDLDQEQPVEGTLSVLDADASQRRCVEAAKRGRSFVMQGPPGTGKSQTITNLIAEAIGQGKRVLFVSEKAAALDVVHRRLTRCGLDEYCLMLHGEHAARREVVAGLHRSLTTSLQPGRRPAREDLDRLVNLRTLLNDSAELLHLPQSMLGGRTLREVHEQLAALHEAPSTAGSPEASSLEPREVMDEYHRLNEVFQRLAEGWHVSPAEFVWRGFSGTRFSSDDRGRVLAELAAVARKNESVSELVHTRAFDLAG